MRNGSGLTRRHAGVGAVVAALAVGLAIPLLREVEPAEEPPVTPGPTSPAPDIGRIEEPVVYDVDFVDSRRAFALWGRCTNGQDFRCERRLLVTEDGRSWTERAFDAPELGAPDRLVGRLVSLGGDRIVLTELVGGGPNDRFHSGDGGRSWRPVPPDVAAAVDTIPPDAVLETKCVLPDRTECRRNQVVAMLPESGQRAWLATPPELEMATPEPRPAADGSWWVTGRDRLSGQWAVAVSRDGGRSWPVALLPVAFGTQVDRISVAAAGATVYAMATAARREVNEPRSLVGIFASTDGGRTWLQTWRATGGSPRTLGGAAIVTPDGGLLIPASDVGPSYRSPDGGYHFTPVFDAPRVTLVRRTRAGYLAVAAGRSPTRYLTSADGVTWSDLRFP